LAPLSLEHLNQVVDIEAASFDHPWPRGLFLGELAVPQARDRVALLQPAGMVLAFILLWLSAGRARVQNLAVHPAFRRRGIGRWLLLSTLAEAKAAGALSVVLEVRTGNQAAKRLYASLGFQPRELRPGYYREQGEDALVMLRSLEGLPGLTSEKS
jgi:[ribosomal protein S18]-alanine N-acetyltransferase